MKLCFLLSIFLFFACSDNKRDRENDQIVYTGVMWQGIQNPSMPCDWIRLFDHTYRQVLGFLIKSYGESTTCLELFIKRYPEAHFHIYLSQGVCQRKNNCSAKEAKSKQEILTNLRAAQEIEKSCPNCSVSYVLQLEDNFSNSEACQYAQFLKNSEPSIELWRNPINGTNVDDSCFDGIELHNTASPDLNRFRRTAYSNDGFDLRISDSKWEGESLSRSELRDQIHRAGGLHFVLLWKPEGNCISGDTARELFPHDRDCSLSTSSLTQLNRLLLVLEDELWNG